MAKKKRKTVKRIQDKQQAPHSKTCRTDRLTTEATQSFRDQIRSARANPHIDHTLFEGLDYDPVRQKRRIQAVLATMDQVKSLAGDPQIDHPEVFTVASDWIDINAYPLAGYDLEERYTCAAFAAAIWILDQLKEADRLDCIDTVLFFESDNEQPIPAVWDPCHTTESIEIMLNAIHMRNGRLHEGRDTELQRIYMTESLAKGSRERTSAECSAYDEIISSIPGQAVENAVAHYERVYWDWVSRYYRSRIILARIEDRLYQQSLELRSELNNLLPTEHPAEASAVQLAMRNTVSANGDLPFPMPFSVVGSSTGSIPFFEETRDLVLRRSLLDQSQDEIEQQTEDLWHFAGHIPQWPYEKVCNVFGEEIADIWEDFDTGDPYEMAFAFLYLLDSGSDLPWCYFPGTNIHTASAGRLPWTRSPFIPWSDGVFYHFDKDAAQIKCGPADPALPKRIRIPELEDWYQLKYTRRGEQKPELHNLAQIIYEITGCIMPRNLDRYLPALKTLDQYGITGKRAIHPLLYCMTLLGEARHRSDGFYPETDSEDEEEEQPVQNQENTIESMQKQIADLKDELKRQKQQTYDNAREARDMRERYESMAQLTANELQELHDLRELVFHQQEPHFEDEAPSYHVSFPYTSENRIVVFGGHESWAREIKPKLPNVRFVDRSSIPNANMIRNADVIWIQTNALCHPHFYKIVDEAKKSNVPIRYFSYSSPIKCAEQLVEEDRKML